MDRKTKPESGATDQHARFLETAGQLVCDEDEAAFDEKLKAVAKAKPKTETPGPQEGQE